MGLEQDILPYIQEKAINLSLIRSKLKQLGWQNVNFGFQLGRKIGAIDIQREGTRCLIYLASSSDQESYQLLAAAAIPTFPVVYQGNTQPEKVAIASIPQKARALDGMQFPDQKPSTGYLGSYEIMNGISKLLAEIFNKTSRIPNNLSLNKLALVVGETDIIRLVPPLNLQVTSDWKILADQLLKDLQEQDPQNSHVGQINFFEYKFKNYLTHD